VSQLSDVSFYFGTLKPPLKLNIGLEMFVFDGCVDYIIDYIMDSDIIRDSHDVTRLARLNPTSTDVSTSMQFPIHACEKLHAIHF
jgi:hypothetical protein